MHDTRDVQQMGIRLAVYKRELSLRTPAAEYTGVDCPALASHTVCLLGRYWSPSLVLFKSKSGSIFGSRSGRKREREGRNFLAVCNWMWHGFKRLCLICWGFFLSSRLISLNTEKMLWGEISPLRWGLHTSELWFSRFDWALS